MNELTSLLSRNAGDDTAEPRGVSASDDFREQQRADFRAAMCREYEERQAAGGRAIHHGDEGVRADGAEDRAARARVGRARAQVARAVADQTDAIAAGDGGELCVRVAKGDATAWQRRSRRGRGPSELGGYPALVLGTVGGHAAILRLLAARADVDAQEHELHATALYVAADLGHGGVGALGAGAAVDQPTAEAATPLLVACYQGRVRCAELLLAAQADAGACMVGVSLLFLAAQQNRLACVALLLEHVKAKAAAADGGAASASDEAVAPAEVRRPSRSRGPALWRASDRLSRAVDRRILAAGGAAAGRPARPPRAPRGQRRDAAHHRVAGGQRDRHDALGGRRQAGRPGARRRRRDRALRRGLLRKAAVRRGAAWRQRRPEARVLGRASAQRGARAPAEGVRAPAERGDGNASPKTRMFKMKPSSRLSSTGTTPPMARLSTTVSVEKV